MVRATTVPKTNRNEELSIIYSILIRSYSRNLDYYLCFPGLTIAIACGDVVGRGIRAASVMGRLRNALRAYAFEGLAPARVVDQLNALTHFLDTDEMATLLYAVVDPVKRELTMVNAGHLPPVVSRPGRPAEFFDRSGTPPLGARPSLRSTAHILELEPGTVVLLYTDGLVERRAVSLSDRLEMLRQLIDADRAFDSLPDALLDELADDETNDDVAFLAVRFAAEVSGPYRIKIPAQPAQLAQVRSMMRTWLSDLHVPGALAYDVLVATGEACANAIEHAYGPRPGEVEISLSRSEGRLAVSVKDEGSWREARGTNRGRGLPIMKKLATTVDVVRTDDGTDVRLAWNLTGADA